MVYADELFVSGTLQRILAAGRPLRWIVRRRRIVAFVRGKNCATRTLDKIEL